MIADMTSSSPHDASLGAPPSLRRAEAPTVDQTGARPRARALAAFDPHTVSSVTATLRAHCLRPTSIRVQILSVLERHAPPDGLMNPYDIHRVILSQGQSVSVPSIYNVLSLLADSGIIRRIKFGDRPSLFSATALTDSIAILVCEHCSDMRSVVLPDHHSDIKEIAASQGFSLVENTWLLRGSCAQCSAGVNSKSSAR